MYLLIKTSGAALPRIYLQGTDNMTLTQFYKDAGISTKKSDNLGRSYQCIIEQFEENAQLGFEQGFLTVKQRDAVIQRGRSIADSLHFS